MSNPKIGLICTSHNYTHVGENKDLIETGAWRISKSKIESLMENDLFLTESSRLPAYAGGRIVGYRKDKSGRYILYFQTNSSYVGYDNHIDAWSHTSSKGARNPIRYFNQA